MTAQLATDDDPICTARFIKEKLRDPIQDDRQNCALTYGHLGWHSNVTHDLQWEDGAGISIREVLAKIEEEERAAKAESTRKMAAKLLEQEEPLDVDGKAKANMWFLGTLNGLHQKLDVLRVEDGHAIDHNVEQAQIALEVASMRLMQVQNILADEIAEAKEKESPRG